MAVDKKKLLERHNAVRKDFKRMQTQRKHKYNYIIKQLAKKHFYSEKRIEEIICMDENHVIYRNQNQLKLFKDER